MEFLEFSLVSALCFLTVLFSCALTVFRSFFASDNFFCYSVIHFVNSIPENQHLIENRKRKAFNILKPLQHDITSRAMIDQSQFNARPKKREESKKILSD